MSSQNFDSIPTLRSIYYYPTSRCNLKCVHCWIAPSYQKKRALPSSEELTLSQINSFYEEAKCMGMLSTKLTGGEPFLRSDLNEILMLIHNKGISIQMETNGTFITEEYGQVLKEISSKDKQFFISLSLDGLEKNHENQRHVKGCFQKTMKGLRILSSNQIPVQIIFSVCKKNAQDLKEIIQLASDHSVRSFKINFINDIERGVDLKKQNQLLDVTECLELNDAIQNLASTASIKIMTNLPPVFKNIPDFLRCGKCGILGIMAILADGSISLCGIGMSVKQLIAGNVNTHSLKEVWENSALFKEIRKTIPRQLQGVCGRCILKSYCLGECRADAYYKNHNLCASFGFCQNAYDQGLFPKKWLIA